MKFVLLGDDPACLPLLRAITRAQEHELAIAAHPGELWQAVSAIEPGVRLAPDWQALLIEQDVAAAVVAGHSPEVLDGAKALARAGCSLVVFPDPRQTSAFVYDLWPLDEEGRATLVPLLGADDDDQWRSVRNKMRDPERGPLRYIGIERTVGRERHAAIPLPIAEHHLLHDCDLLRRLCGHHSRVTCVAVGMSDDAVSRLTVTLTGDEVPEAIWNISATPHDSAATLEVVGGGPTLGYPIPAPSSPGLCESSSADADAAGERQLAVVAARLSGATTEPRWSDAVRAFDVVEAARRSLRRRRTVEIGSEGISESRQFKSIMTAAGCGVLVYTLLGVVAALLVAVAVDPRDAAYKRSAAADFIVRTTEFHQNRPSLTEEGHEHVKGIASRLWTTTADVLIEPAPDANAESLNAQRRTTVETALAAEGAANFSDRVVTRPLIGRWFEHLMIGVWLVVFAPLVVLLATQLLVLAARPDARSNDGNSAEA